MPSRRQFLTTSTLSLAGLLSTRETKANQLIRYGQCTSPVFNTIGNYEITRLEEGYFPRVRLYWQNNRNWTSDGYIETVEREEVLRRVEQNRKIFETAENIASDLGFPNPFNEIMQKIQEGLGIRDPKQFTLDALLLDLSPELSQELLDVQRWDIYKHTAGTIAGNRVVTISNYISFRPSNIPEIKDINVEIQGNTAIISWQGYDRTTYPELNLPWYKFRFPQLPLNDIDLTIFLNEPYDGTVPMYYLLLIDPNTNTAIRNEGLVAKTRYLDASEVREFSGTTISIPNLATRLHKLRIQAIDDVMNLSEPAYSQVFFPEGQQIAEQPKTQSQTTNDRQSIEDVIKRFNNLFNTLGDGTISEEDINNFNNFFTNDVSENYSKSSGKCMEISPGWRHKSIISNIKTHINRNRATAYFDMTIINPPKITETLQINLIKENNKWKIDYIPFDF